MKKLVISLIIFLFPICLSASGGKLVQKSVKECSDGNLYGYHLRNGERHYHIAVKNENGIFVASNKEIISKDNPCNDKVETEKIEVLYKDCVDGDTAEFMLNGENIKVRFLAIDTPETVHPDKGEEPYGKEASNYTCDKIKNGTKIILEFDPDSEKFDKYNRYLAWVYVDDELLQKELISLGYAKVAYLYGDYLYTEELENLEEVAKENHLGIWGDYEEKFDYMTIFISILALIIVIIRYYILGGKKKWKK